ncbi:unnamed protein product [Calicophoron daubneyi]|uniref:Sepiapterin reductase n=1 Tax=Calicophoron daubneyi TaxID=300641 RepID=A0AAV2TMN6_CALDB
MASKMECLCDSKEKVDAPWSGLHCYIAITGASRGFGRALCLQLTEELTSGPGRADSVSFLLMARDLSRLEETREMIMAAKDPTSQTRVKVLLARPPLDMVNANESAAFNALQPLFQHAETTGRNGRQWNLLIHNAGSLGDLELRADERTSVEVQDAYYRVNLLAPMLITGVFLRYFAPIDRPHPPVTIVNVSSLAAEEPFPRMSDYCVAKAARQMYMKCLAVDRPAIAVFNYSPGPLDTDMHTEIAEKHGDPNYRAAAAELKSKHCLITSEDSARVCVSWLRRRHLNYEAGDHTSSEPKAIVCPLHQADRADIWTGPRLDYYDAISMEPVAGGS